MNANLQDLRTCPTQNLAVVEPASLAAAVEQAADGIVVTDLGGKIQYVNPSFTTMTGYSSEEAVGQNPRLLKSGCHPDAFYEELWSAIRSGEIWQGEMTNRRKDGTFYDEEMRIAPVRDPQGAISGYIAIKHEVTEKRAAQNAQALLASIVESSHDAIVSCSPTGVTTSWNRGATELFGYTAGEMIGKHASMLLPPDRQRDLESCVRQASQGVSVSQFEGFGLRKDGSRFHVCVTSSPITNPAGELVSISAVIRDITERKQAEQALRESEERFRAMADACPSMMFVTDVEGKVEYINRAYREYSGITCDEARVGEWRALLHPDDAAGYLESFAQAVSARASFSAEARVRRADRAWRLVGARAEPRFSPTGEYLGHIGLRADITERRQAEQDSQFQHSLIRAIYEGSKNGILVVDPNNTIVSHNKKFLDIWGLSFPGASGKPPYNIVGIEQQPVLSEILQRVNDPESYLKRVRELENNPDMTDYGEVELKDGRTMERYSTSLWDDCGKYLGRARFFQDITERKQVEHELHESENRFRIMADGCPMPMWVTDADGGIQFTNRIFREFCGTPHEQVDGHKWELLIHPDDLPEFMMQSSRSAVDHVPFKAEARAKRADGEWRLLLICAEPRFSDGGKFLGGVGLSVDITERKQAEQALHESEDRFRIMADSCPLGIWVTDAVGRARFMNRVFREFAGTTSDDISPDAWVSLIHPDDLPEIVEALQASLKEHVPFKAERRHRRADGEWRWVESYAEPRFTPDGEFQGLVGTSRDITERKESEKALQISEEKFRQLTENIREILWLKNPGTDDFLYISPAYEQIFGMTCASFYANPASRLEAIHPDDLERYRLAFARQTQGDAVENEYRIRTPEGQEKWIRSRSFPVRNHAGQLIRIAGIGEDITQQKHYEAKLIHAQAAAEEVTHQLSTQHAILDGERKVLRTFLDNVPDRMYVKDLESRFVVANPEVARCMGVEKPEELLGKTDFDFFPPEFASIFYEDEQRVIRTGVAMFDREETSGMGTADEVRYILTTKVPLFDGDGRVTGIAGIGRDITLRKTIEDQICASNRELQEATDWANKMALEAEAANQAKSEFLANMSHEIRTPMNGVLGMNGLMLGTDLDTQQRHYAEVIDDSAKSLLKVIDDILDFSKVEAGKLEIDHVEFNLQVLMGDFAEMMAERIGEKPLEFVCSVAPNVCAFLEGDPGRLRQVLLNLVGNAMKFTRQGEVVVRVDLVSETEVEVWLRFSVRDTGIGIPTDKQPMLFTSFTQVDASTTRQYGGTGLGLAISKKLIELMGGRIGLESKEGVGSEFWFTVRLVKQPAKRQVDSPKVPIKGTRILVVDDNATNREVLTAQMQSWGAIVASVESGSTALACMRYAVAAGSPFQLAVLDMMMPGMDGATLGRTILSDDALKSIPLVMMTSLGHRGDALRFKEIGFAAYLVKPVRQSDLFDCLVDVLTGERQKETRSLITRHSLQAARRSNARILLVEDNLTNQEVVSGMLSRMGWRADLASDGKKALQALETHPYDLVLMDVQMPEMDGYEATRVIRDPRSQVLNHHIPIIATTAHALTGDAEKCLAVGMSDYISKPIDPKLLAKMVEKWLSQKVHCAHGEVPAESVMDCQASPQTPLSISLVFNREAFLERMMGDVEFAHEVVAGFVKELPTLLSTMREQVALGALELIWKQAHKIKGSAANVGGEALSAVASEMEQAGKAGDLATVVHLIPELEIQTARLSEALQQWTN